MGPLYLDPTVLSFDWCLFILTGKSLTRKMYCYVLLFLLSLSQSVFWLFKDGKGVGCFQKRVHNLGGNVKNILRSSDSSDLICLIICFNFSRCSETISFSFSNC